MDKIKIAFDVVRKMKIVAIVLLAVLVTSSFVGATATINVYLDDLPSQAYFTGETDGTNYWMTRHDGYKAFESTNSSYVVNSALLALPAARLGLYQLIVSLVGKWVIPANNPILLPSWVILDLYQANLTLGTGSSRALIENADQLNGNTKMAIWGGRLDAQKSGQLHGAYGIYINNSVTYGNVSDGIDMTPSEVIVVKDTYIIESYDDCMRILLNTGDSMILDHTWAMDTTHVSYNLQAGDSRLETLSCGSYRENLIIMGGTFLVSNCYFGGNGYKDVSSGATVYIYDDDRSQFSNCLIDANRYHGFILNQSNYITFVGTRIRADNTLNATNTWDGWVLYNSNNCSIGSGCYAGRYDATKTKWLRFGLIENGTSNYNMIVGFNGYDVATAGIIVVGASTRVADSWNMTTWVDSFP